MLGAVSVITVKPHHGDTVHQSALHEECTCILNRYAGAVHAQVHIHQDIGPETGFGALLPKGAYLSLIVTHCPETDLGVGLHQLDETADIRAYQRVCHEDMGCPAAGGHLCFRYGGALKTGYAGFHLKADHLRHLVGLYMGPQISGSAGQVHCLLNIFFNDIQVIDQGRGDYIFGFFKLIMIIHNNLLLI